MSVLNPARLLPLACLALLCLGGFAYGADEAATAPSFKEYFVDQAAGTALLIRMEAFEAEFESRIYGPEDALLKASGLPGLRMGPVFQFIDATNSPRQLRVQVVVGGKTDRYKLDMRLTKFDESGPDSTFVTRAYRLLSTGLEVETSRRADAWTMKVVSLNQAANIFEQLGMQEMQLWSSFYGHYLLLQLGDPVTAAEGAREIEAAASRSKLQPLRLAALQLEAQAISRQRAPGTTQLSASAMERTQDLFRQAGELAAELDMQHERARALFFSGLTFEESGRKAEAFAEYDRAIEVTVASGDTSFANQIRKRAADLHESLGQNAEAIALMREISANTTVAEPRGEEEEPEAPQSEASKAGAARSEREMTAYLFEQGRLLEKTYRHAEAAEVLYQALELNSAASASDLTGPIGLQLARSLHGAGQVDSALQVLQEALVKTSASRYGRAVQEGYGLLAEIQRGRGSFEEMTAARERQGMFFPAGSARATFAYEQALDALAKEGRGQTSSSSSARALFREAITESRAEVRAGGASVVAHLAELQLCALGHDVKNGGAGTDSASCAGPRGQQALSYLTVAGLPALSMQARFLWWQILRRAGQSANATLELDSLIEDMRFYQLYLPGVLGAWYWQHRDQVFEAAMELALAGAEASGEKAFTELARLQNIDREQRAARTALPAGVEEAKLNDLRSLHAEREAATDPQVARSIDAEITQATKAVRARMPGRAASGSGLIADLRQWRDGEGLLSYYFTPKRAYAWLGSNQGLRLIGFAWSPGQSESLSRQLEALRWDAANATTRGAAVPGATSGATTAATTPEDFVASTDRLGEMLLAPLGVRLPEVIYFLPSGRLEGLPLDALRLDGAFVAETHRVVNLVSAEAPANRSPQLQGEALQQVFLGARRLEQAGDFSVVQRPSAEVTALADLFVGPGLNIRQGAALQWDEIHDERFTQAGLIHLAVPCTVDLRDPSQSSLLLSDNAENPEQGLLSPADIEAQALRASLVVLSACDFAGSNTSQFAHNTRFPGEFLHAGAGVVIASQWSPGDTATAEFMSRFYQALQTQPDVGRALHETRKSYLATGSKGPGSAWAAFQLFID